MAMYPDWLMKYKTKGIYVKKTKSGYSLYRGHSERIPGKNYPVFKCDEYLGIVTEKDGLIPFLLVSFVLKNLMKLQDFH